jgi:hypothetical protein
MKHGNDKREQWRLQKQAYRKRMKEYTLIFSAEYAVKIEKYAMDKGMNVTEYFKALIGAQELETGYIVPKNSHLQDLILEIRRIGNNINQLVRYCNTNKVVSMNEISYLKQKLDELEKCIAVSLTKPQKSDH